MDAQAVAYYETYFASLLEWEPTEEDLADYHPEEDAMWLEELNGWYSASRGV